MINRIDNNLCKTECLVQLHFNLFLQISIPKGSCPLHPPRKSLRISFSLSTYLFIYIVFSILCRIIFGIFTKSLWDKINIKNFKSRFIILCIARSVIYPYKILIFNYQYTKNTLFFQKSSSILSLSF